MLAWARRRLVDVPFLQGIHCAKFIGWEFPEDAKVCSNYSSTCLLPGTIYKGESLSNGTGMGLSDLIYARELIVDYGRQKLIRGYYTIERGCSCQKLVLVHRPAIATQIPTLSVMIGHMICQIASLDLFDKALPLLPHLAGDKTNTYRLFVIWCFLSKLFRKRARAGKWGVKEGKGKRKTLLPWKTTIK